MTRICYVSAPDIMLRPTTSSLLWPGPKSEENLWENIDDTSPKAKCGGDGTIESFLDNPTKSGTQHKRIIL